MASLSLPRPLHSSTAVLQVPVQRVLGLHCTHLVSQPPQVPVRHPLQRLGLGRVPPRQSSPGEDWHPPCLYGVIGLEMWRPHVHALLKERGSSPGQQ